MTTNDVDTSRVPGHPTVAVHRLPVTETPMWEWAETVGLQDTSGWSINQLAGIAAGNARVYARTRIAEARWSGEVEHAAQVASVLVDNAVRHGGVLRVPLRLALIATGRLLIEATDGRPEFPESDTVLKWERIEHERRRGGLWRVHCCGATLSYAVNEDGAGKTVQAVMMPTPEVMA